MSNPERDRTAVAARGDGEWKAKSETVEYRHSSRKEGEELQREGV